MEKFLLNNLKKELIVILINNKNGSREMLLYFKNSKQLLT